MPDVTVTIDGQSVTVPAGTNVVDAARAAAVSVPVFCYHPKIFEPVERSPGLKIDVLNHVLRRDAISRYAHRGSEDVVEVRHRLRLESLFHRTSRSQRDSANRGSGTIALVECL